jgi:hypothetical protein
MNDTPQSAEGQGWDAKAKEIRKAALNASYQSINNNNYWDIHVLTRELDSRIAKGLDQAYAQGWADLDNARLRISAIVRVIEKVEEVDKDWLLEVLQAPMIMGAEAIRVQPEGETRMNITAEEFDRRAEAGEDMSEYFMKEKP